MIRRSDGRSGADIVLKYFPDLSPRQRDRFKELDAIYREWNARVNLISRNDIGHLYERHILHSLAIAKVADLPAGSSVLDVGTGGGFPGIPLAILLPRARFHLIDGIGKKITAVKAVIAAQGLENATAEQVRSEDHRGSYDAIMSRSVTALPRFVRSVRHLLKPGGSMFCLKGGELADEVLPLRGRVAVFELSAYFQEEFFRTKKIVRVRPGS